MKENRVLVVSKEGSDYISEPIRATQSEFGFVFKSVAEGTAIVQRSHSQGGDWGDYTDCELSTTIGDNSIESYTTPGMWLRLKSTKEIKNVVFIWQ